MSIFHPLNCGVYSTIRRTRCGFALLVALVVSGAAHADVVGRVRLHVSSLRDSKPAGRFRIILSDCAGVRPTLTLTTNAHGDVLSPPLENRDWHINAVTMLDDVIYQPGGHAMIAGPERISFARFRPQDLRISVVADTTTDVTLLVDVPTSSAVKIIGTDSQVSVAETGNVTHRDQDFIHRFPVTAGNPQSLGAVLRTTPRLGVIRHP